MHMTPKTRTIPDDEFEANCLALLDEVAETGEEIVVTKQGKPVVKVVGTKIAGEDWGDDGVDDGLTDSVVFVGDIVSPVGEEDWELLP